MGAVRAATDRLRRGDADKVVLAREVLVESDGVMRAGTIAGALRASYPSCFTYLVTGDDGTALIGASPELLVRRQGGVATCQPMAGSIARGQDDTEDRALAEELRASAKNGAEHLVTARRVAAALAPLSIEVRRQEPEIVRYTNIQHLATTIEATLRDPAPGVLQLAGALHPTPAVGGMPPDGAVRLIDALEGMERGWYAGAVGWMDARCDGELAIALRCGLLCPEGVRLFAGVGVMPDSDAASELEETELKLRALGGALGTLGAPAPAPVSSASSPGR
jgi:salicylate biosynthesis isochorismate synthase/menaquinone-specific isochorismate synthase